MNDESRRILEMLAEGKITVDEAQQLLRAVAPDAQPAGEQASSQPEFLRVSVHKNANGDVREKDVNVRVPLALIKAGIRLGALMPGAVGDQVNRRLRERGLDLSKVDASSLDGILRNLGNLSIDVDGGKAQIVVTAE